MAHKRSGQLTVSGEWARHLRPYFRRIFWKRERVAEKAMLQSEIGQEPDLEVAEDANQTSSDSSRQGAKTSALRSDA